MLHRAVWNNDPGSETFSSVLKVYNIRIENNSMLPTFIKGLCLFRAACNDLITKSMLKELFKAHSIRVNIHYDRQLFLLVFFTTLYGLFKAPLK